MAAVKQRAKLNASLLGVKEAAPAADLSSIRIVRRDKAPVVALADSRIASPEPTKAPVDGAFYKKGSATAATFRPTYWSYERRTVEDNAPVPSLEEQIGARQHSSAPTSDRDTSEKPPASLYQPIADREPPALAPETIALLLSQTGSASDDVDDNSTVDIEALLRANAPPSKPLAAETSLAPEASLAAEAASAPVASSPAPPDEAIGEEAAPLAQEPMPPAVALLLSSPTAHEAPSGRADIVPFPITPPRADAPPIEELSVAEAITPAAPGVDVAPLSTQGRDVAATSAPPVATASPALLVDVPPQQPEAAAPAVATEPPPPIPGATPVDAATTAVPEVPAALQVQSAQPVDRAPAPPIATEAIPTLPPAVPQGSPFEQPTPTAPEPPRNEVVPIVAPARSDLAGPVEARSGSDVARREKSSKTKLAIPQKAEDPVVAAFIRELGATIDAVLAARWYGTDRPDAHPVRAANLSHELQAVTPSSLIAELAAVRRKDVVAQPPRSRKGGAILGLAVALMIAAAGFFGWSLWHVNSRAPLRAPAYRSEVAPAAVGAFGVAQMERTLPVRARPENTKRRPPQS